jgi:hypothetical protein
MAESEFYVGKEPTMFEFEGASVVIGPGTVIEAGHPILAGRESLFTPLVVHYRKPTKEEKAEAKAEAKAEEKAEAKPEPKRVEPPVEKRTTHTR